MADEKARIAVFVSGGGTNLQALIDAERSGALHSGTIALVVSNKPDVYALERASASGIPAETAIKAQLGGQEGLERRLLELLEAHRIDMIVLAGYLNILSAAFTERFPRRILNIHPSLIPSFCGDGYYGLRVHEEALQYGVKVTGATVHYVNGVTDGGEILLQKAVAVQEGDTPEILQRRVMEQAEWVLLPQAAEMVARRIVQERESYKDKRSKRAMTDFIEFLQGNPYPGRGIAVGKGRVYYFIMGRSENSRNRIFSLTDDGIRTEAHDPSKMQDPSLIIYHPVRAMGDDLIVTNGDQTDTIRDMGDFRKALMTRQYEPDAPNNTPRISAILHADGSFELSILKEKDGGCLREFFCYEGCPEGKGYFISTYEGDGSPLPSFSGEPMEITMPSPEEVWAALNKDNKVSLYTWVEGKVKLFNKNLGD